MYIENKYSRHRIMNAGKLLIIKSKKILPLFTFCENNLLLYCHWNFKTIKATPTLRNEIIMFSFAKIKVASKM